MFQNVGAQSMSGRPLSRALDNHFITNDQYNDQWLLQSHIGVRAFLDHEHNVSVGITKGYMYNNLSPLGMRGWSSTTADLTIRFNSIPVKAIVRRIRKPRKLVILGRSSINVKP